MKVYFYLPPENPPEILPEPSDVNWEKYSIGKYSWCLLTYNRLKLSGVHCELTHQLPETGIIIAHRACLPDSIIPSHKQILVCIQADWGRHPFAQLHICQNLAQTVISGVPRLERFGNVKTYFVHHWPQPGIICRDPHRGETFQNIYYFGLAENLAPELKSANWHQFIAKNGFKWNLIDSQAKWKNYRDVDIVLFVRDFDGKAYINKPASKLCNAWITGAIPVCTNESAYLDEIKNNDDALVVKNYEDLKEQLIALKNTPSRIINMRMRCAQNGPNYLPDRVCAEWTTILEEIQQYEKTRRAHTLFLVKRCFSWVLCKGLRWLR